MAVETAQPGGRSDSCLFSARIVNIDFYMSPPLKDIDVSYSEFRSAATEKVPVIRIFGATPLGQKTCLHLHCVFPYLFVPCAVTDPSDAYLRQLARSVDSALQLSLGVASKPAIHVYKIVVVRGIPLYGYHATEELFLKVYLYNPLLIKRLADLLLAGAVMNTVMQPHESHIPYVLQAMIDYNLFGMSFIHLSAVRFRLGAAEQNPSQGSTHSHCPSPSLASPSLSPSYPLVSPSQMSWDVDTLPSAMVHCVPRASVCDLEVDALAVDVLNRQELSMASGSYPGLVAIWEEEKQRRQVLGNNTALTPPASPDRHPLVNLPTERRLRVEFDAIVKERLGLSSDSEREKSLTPSSTHYSQSCDIEQHRPISRENSDVIARQPIGEEEEEALVNEEKVHQSMELSQRLSPEAIRTSTDAELLALLLDLAHTPQDEAPQSMYSSQSISQSLSSSKPSKTQSDASGSLFGSSPSGDNEKADVGSERKNSTCGIEPAFLFSPISTLTSDDELFDNSPEALIDDDASLREDAMDVTRHENATPDPKLHSSDSTPVGHSGSELAQRSFRSGISDTSFALSLDSEDSRHSLAVIPKSPLATEEEVESQKEDLDLIGSQFDIPCAQLMAESSPPPPPPGLLEDLAQAFRDDVQLEYDISNVNISEFDSSDDPLLSVLESPPAQEIVPMLLPDSIASQFDSAQPPPVQLSELQRRDLIRLCSGDLETEEDLLEHKSSSGEESEEENVWMSQHDWGDDSLPQQQMLQSQQSSTIQGSMHEADTSLDVHGDKEVEELFSDTIAQLDGSGDMPKRGRRGKTTKKTLGVKRKRKSESQQLPPKQDSFPSILTPALGGHHPAAVASTADVDTLQVASGSEEKSDLPANLPKKQRPSLSLKKRSKDVGILSLKLEHSKEYGQSSESDQHAPQCPSGLPPQDSLLQRKALEHSKRLQLRLVKVQDQEEQLDEYFGRVKRSRSSLSEDEPAAEQTSKQKMEAAMHVKPRARPRSKPPSGNLKSKPQPESQSDSQSSSKSQSNSQSKHVMKTRSASGTPVSNSPASPDLARYTLENYAEEELLQIAIAESLKTATPFQDTCTYTATTTSTGSPNRILVSSGGLDIGEMSDHQSPQRASLPEPPLPLISPEGISTAVVVVIEPSDVCMESGRESEPEDFGRPAHLLASPPSDSRHSPSKKRSRRNFSGSLTDDDHYSAASETDTDLEESDFHLVFTASSSEDSTSASDDGETGGTCSRSMEGVSLHEVVTLSRVRQREQRGDPPHLGVKMVPSDWLGSHKDPRMVKPLSAGSESEETLSASEGEGQGEGSAGVHSKKLKAVMTFQQTEEVGAQRRDLLTGAAPDAVAVKRLPAGSESEDTLSASEGEGQGEGSRLHSQSPEATSRQTVMTFQQTEEVTMRRREDLSGPTSAAIPDSESEDTLSASEGEGQGEESVRLRSGTPGFDSQRGVVTIQGSGEVRMKKADLLVGSLPESLDFRNDDLLKTTAASGDETLVRGKMEQSRAVLLPLCRPPTAEEVMRTAASYGLPQVIHRRAFYSKPADVQPAKDVGGRAVRVPSKMAYELQEFEPRYRNVEGSSTHFSQMGLEQWRAVLGSLSLDSGTQPVLPPPCHAHGVARDAKAFPGGYYSSVDHRRDVELRAAFYINGATVVTPALPPPHPRAVSEWYERRLQSFSAVRPVLGGGGGEASEGRHRKTRGDPDAGVSSTGLPAKGRDETETTLIASTSQTLTPTVGGEHRNAAVGKNTLERPAHDYPLLSEGETDPLLSKTSPGSTPSSSQVVKFEEMLKSPGSARSDSSADNLSVYSLTSYQVPISLLENPVSVDQAESSGNETTGEKPDVVAKAPPQGDNDTRNLLVSLLGSQESVKTGCPDVSVADLSQLEATLGGRVPTATALPRHSTPVVVDGGRVGGGAGAEVPSREATPVRMKEVRVDCASSQRVRLPFTPITQLKKETSQLEGPTPNNTFGFKLSQSALPGASNSHEVQHLTSMSLELHARTRGTLRPDPEFDPVLAVFYYIHNDWPTADGTVNCRLGVIAIDVDSHPVQEAGDSPGKKPKSPAKRTGMPTQLSPLKVNQSAHSPGKTRSPKKAVKSLGKTPGKTPPCRGASPGKKGRTASPLAVTVGATPVASSQPSADGASGAADCAAVMGETGASVIGAGDSSVVEMNCYLARCGLSRSIEVSYATSEADLIEQLVKLVRKTDPDFLIGYEVVMTSWGYLIDRAAALNINLANELSRMPNLPGVKHSKGAGSGGRRTADLRIVGRTVINVWKIMRHEIALNTYSFENVCYHILHQRVPLFSHQSLTRWYQHSTRLYRYRVVEHYIRRCHGSYHLLENFNVICRTSEFARLYGIEFESVLSRGSQYRVESMLLRLAKPSNFIPVSPSVQQRARMAAPECIPLVLEPESKFYVDPVVLLDFQSLYPSIIIGHNYCFTTCLGRLRNLALHGDYTFGTNSLSVPPHVLNRIKDDVSISPNGVVFVKPNVRRGLMPRMLEEILGTRIMVKSSMKQHKGNKALGRMLDARQLGLKLIANVTYGYTAASFCGRMPCIEIGDSIVRKARETLERAIQLVNSTPEWRARVVYGDTDSLFILLKGAAKEEAFRIGREICRRVTADNPKPVKLKFEKVYLPCILQTKKRYMGFMYEAEDQVEPQFDAKGSETVRRDTCPAVAKVLEKSLRILFTTRDLSLVKTFVQRQFSKLLDGHVSIQDYTFAKEYRGRSNYRPGACVPALELAKRNLALDRRSEPRPGERVPYVVVYGGPGQPLIQLVRDPGEVARDPTLRLNGTYYITKQILPALDRAFSLVGVDVRQWYTDLPRVFRAPMQVPQEANSKRLKGTIGQYFGTMHCPICKALTVDSICTNCRADPQKVAVSLNVRIQAAEKENSSIVQLCQNCVGTLDLDYSSKCISLDCPVFYRLHRTKQELAAIATSFRTTLHNVL